jgi:S-DNA-T family DNA segregation ATPase FtsK/SpoIIIE
MLVDASESLAALAAIAFGRWAYRHRSAFAPFLLALTVFVASGIAHPHHSGWWIPLTPLTVVLTLVTGVPHSLLRRRPRTAPVARFLHRVWSVFGIDRGIERGYLASILGFTGTWAAFALANGATRKPLPQILLIGTLILGIPWWFHRRRRSRVRVERTIQAWPSIAESVGLPGSRLVSVVVDKWGWSARLKLRRGTPSTEAIARIPHIESGLGERPGSVRMVADARKADEVTVRVVEIDPHANPIAWAGPSVTSITQPMDIGLFEDGRKVLLSLLRRNILVAGMVGSGKSGILNIILGNLVACHDVEIWGVDLKEGMELAPWEPCLDRLATTPEQAVRLFQDAIGELNRRARLATENRWRVWQPTRRFPALVIIVDEYAELPEDAQDYADSVARRGRAVAVNLIAATQRPTQKAMGTNAVRSQMDVRIALRVREPRDVDLVLGQGSYNAGWNATTLTQPGVFLISAPEHTRSDRARAYLLTDDAVERHVIRHAQRRPNRPGAISEKAREDASEPSTANRPEIPQDAGNEAASRLWRALCDAGPEGAPIGELMAACGMARPTLYRHLAGHAAAERAVQVTRGFWRAVRPEDSHPDRPPTTEPSQPPNRPPTRRAERHKRRRAYLRRPPGRHGA